MILKIRTILLVGTLIRLALMPFIAHPFDIYSWYVYCNRVLEQGFSLDLLRGSLNPLWPLTLAVVAYIYGPLSAVTGLKAVSVSDLPSSMNPQWGISHVPGPLFNTVVKIPIILSDIAIALLLYELVSKRYGKNVGEKTALLFYLNPAVLWISSAWGQYDSIPALFTVLSTYLLIEKRVVQSSLSLLAAVLFKIYPVAFIVPVSICLYKKEPVKNLLKFLLFFTVSVAFFLFSNWGSILEFINKFFSSRTFHGIFGFGLTYWSISLLYSLDVTIFAPVSVGIMVLLLLVSLYGIYKSNFNDDLKGLTFSAVLLSASVFLSTRYPIEQRIVWLMPFLAIASSKNYISEKLFWTLSLMAFLYMQKTFPYYLLPIATLGVDALMLLFKSTEPFRIVTQDALMPTPLTAAVLSILGVGFSILMLKAYFQLLITIKSS